VVVIIVRTWPELDGSQSNNLNRIKNKNELDSIVEIMSFSCY
jgi:hypothetical protein